MSSTVYLFEDDYGRPAYAGVTDDYTTRWKWHRSTSPWFPEVAYVSLTHYDTRARAEAAESSMIRILRPRFNVNGNPAAIPGAYQVSKQEWVSVKVAANLLRNGLDLPLNGEAEAIIASGALPIHKRAAGLMAIATADIRAYIARTVEVAA